MHYKLAFIGFGNVARALVRLLERKRALLQEQYQITFSVTGIATARHGSAIHPSGLDAIRCAEAVEAGQSLTSFGQIAVSDNFDFIHKCGADLLFENTPVNAQTGQPAVDHVHAALHAGMHVVTANKGTVVYGYHALSELAKRLGKQFLFEATVLGGAPVFSVFRHAFPAAQLFSFEGIINSTTNIILSRMERGETFDQAVRYCQSIGIAEADPSNDVDGWDAAIKVAALVTVLMDIPFTPLQVDRTGIRGITPQMIAEARQQGKRWKLVCSAHRENGEVRARVAPQMVTPDSPLYNMQDSTTGIAFRTDVLGDYTILEAERPGLTPGPEPTAYGLLADFINIARAEA